MSGHYTLRRYAGHLEVLEADEGAVGGYRVVARCATLDPSALMRLVDRADRAAEAEAVAAHALATVNAAPADALSAGTGRAEMLDPHAP